MSSSVIGWPERDAVMTATLRGASDEGDQVGTLQLVERVSERLRARTRWHLERRQRPAELWSAMAVSTKRGAVESGASLAAQ